MHRTRRPWASSRRDTDTAPAEHPIQSPTQNLADEKAAHITTNDLPHPSASVAEAGLKTFELLHHFDPNLPRKTFCRSTWLSLAKGSLEERSKAIEDAVERHDANAELALEHDLGENSVYPEVVAAVRNTDEQMPANTVRGKAARPYAIVPS
jgi:hypothetical protein